MPKTCSRSWQRIVWYIVSKATDRSSAELEEIRFPGQESVEGHSQRSAGLKSHTTVHAHETLEDMRSAQYTHAEPILLSLSYTAVDAQKTLQCTCLSSTPLQYRTCIAESYPIPWFDTRKILPGIWGHSSTPLQDLCYGVYSVLWLTHGRYYSISVQDLHYAAYPIPWFILGNSHRESEASLVHPCIAYVKEFILYRGWHEEDLTGYMRPL